jgi:TetR/AcrR family fatty acid metabolism transcriptional regulator
MPRRISKAQRRQDLVEAARRVFLREGAHALSMSKVAREAGLAKASVFDSFETRDDLLDEVFALEADVVEVDARDPIAAVLDWVRRRVRTAPAPMQALRLAEASRPDGDRPAQLRGPLAMEEEGLAALIRHGIQRGRIASMPPTRAAAVLVGSTYGLAIYLAARGFDEREREARLDDLVAVWKTRLEGR